jgi:hypothetical protein
MPLLIEVGPPSAQWVWWWMSHQAAGVSQWSAWQCRSRAMIARRCAVVKLRVARPESRI